MTAPRNWAVWERRGGAWWIVEPTLTRAEARAGAIRRTSAAVTYKCGRRFLAARESLPPEESVA